MNFNRNKIKILTWNVNSIRVRIPLLLALIAKDSPDVILLQETKCEDQKFPQEELSDLGYQMVLNGQKTYNGVAILSKFTIDSSTTTFTNNPIPEQARFLEAEINLPIGYAKIISVYVPNGGEVGSQNYQMKLEFLKALSEHLSASKKHDEYIIMGGDFNVAAEEIDVFDAERLSCQTCFTLPERKAMRTLLNSGMCDLYRLLNADKKEFSWWDYRGSSLKKDEGMRIDTIISSYNLTKHSITTTILKEWRQCEMPSDHAPVVVEIMQI
jgi:exodeoxyribonuclease-3